MATATVHRHLFTVDDYARMGQAGILTADDRVELIDGEVRTMNPIGPAHAWIVNRLLRSLITRLDDNTYVSSQNPIRLGPHTEPQPDVVVARQRGSAYQARHPEAADVLLVIEVADSSLLYGRLEKAPRYGQAGIPETWIVDVGTRKVTAYTGPGPDGYSSDRVVSAGEIVTSTGVAGLQLPVDEMFG